MILGLSIIMWSGIFAFVSLIATTIIGISMIHLKKKWMDLHKITSTITVILAIVHAVLVILRLYWGISF